jgi:hypothetical protein
MLAVIFAALFLEVVAYSPLLNLGAGGVEDITWAIGPDNSLPDTVSAGGSAHFTVQWGVAPDSASPAARALLTGSFWFGGTITSVRVGAGGVCNLTASTQALTCDLGPVAVGAFAPTLSFDVSALREETAPHYLPVFLGGLNGFANGPEVFARLQVA